jgi:lysophospholipase L1-like esterase
MRVDRVWILGAVFALAGVAQAQDRWVRHFNQRVAAFEAQNRTLPTGKEHVVLVGDSLTEGWERSGRTSRYLPQLAGRVLNRGISSDRVGPPRGVLSRMAASILDTQPSHVVLLVGVNQIGSGGSGIARAARDYEEIVRRVRSRLPQVKLIAVSTPPTRGRYANFQAAIRRYNAKVKEIAKRHGAEFLDLHALLKDSRGELKREVSSDGLHFNSAGYAIYGRALERLIRSGAGPAAPATPTPATPTPATPPGDLREGSTGFAVDKLQRALVDRGAELEVDGKFGPKTRAAVEALQRERGLPVTGVVDARTRAALRGRGIVQALRD